MARWRRNAMRGDWQVEALAYVQFRNFDNIVISATSFRPTLNQYNTPATGVGRKTANVVLGNAFGVNEGIVVDTHVRRVSNRLGLTESQDPVKIEQDLMGIVPEEDWTIFSHLLILHGRRVCKARKPDCPNCVLNDICPSADL